jgi:invasion protein IalB
LGSRATRGRQTAVTVWCIVVMALAVFCPRPTFAQVSSYFATPALNPSLFQKGVVQHDRQTFGNWTLVCDGVAALHQRFCSLVSNATDPATGASIVMIVSTADNEQPAAILRLPVSAALREPLTVSVPESIARNGQVQRRESTLRLGIVACGSLTCMTVWALPPAEIHALTTGDTFTIRFGMPAQVAGLTAPDAATDIDPARLSALLRSYKQPRTVTITLSGRGFNDAIQASQSQP